MKHDNPKDKRSIRLENSRRKDHRSTKRYAKAASPLPYRRPAPGADLTKEA